MADAATPRIDRLRAGVATLVAAWEGRAVLPAEIIHADAGAEWSVAKNLVHVVEFLPYWARAAHEVAGRNEDGLPFGRTHDDPDRVEWIRVHADDELSTALDELRGAGQVATEVLSSITPEGWTRTGRHANRGEMSVATIVDQFMLDHLEAHGRQAEAALDEVRGETA